MTKTKNSFSAASSMTGYLYQCLYALYESLSRVRKGKEFRVSLETLDDVVFEKKGDAIDLIQNKHHVTKKAQLSDYSEDLWKTLRIWSEEIYKGHHKNDLSFFLITTSKSKYNTAAFCLNPDKDKRDVKKSLSLLESVSNTSKNIKLMKSFAAFKLLTQEQKLSLLDSINIIDGSPSITDLDKAMKEEIFWAVEADFLESFLHRIVGWWMRRVINQLTDINNDPILSEEIEDQISELREQFKRDNLPIDEDILEFEINESKYLDKVFVKQLELIDVTNKRIFFAIRDYFRAFEQRSRWVREELLYVGELSKYERKLREEWEMNFESMRQDIGDEATEYKKKKAARELYRWIENGELLQIREGCKEKFVARGSYHLLSDNKLIGWHPEFIEKIQKILESEVA